MSDPVVAVMMLGVFIVLIMLGFPIAFTLMALGVGFGYYAYFDPERMRSIFDNNVFNLFVNQSYSVMSNDVLTAVPLFLFMGYIVERANIVAQLFSTLAIATRRVPGSMAVAALITCALFATATGIVGAVITLMGLLAYPAMLKARYDVNLASGVICAGGTLGILIPPSIMLIVYAATSGVSIVKLYAAAMLPGLLLAGLYVVYVVGRSVLQPSIAPKPPKEDYEDIGRGDLATLLAKSFVPLALLILSVLGAILFGLATPSEAASIGALGGLVLAASYHLNEFFTEEGADPYWAGWRLDGGAWGLMPSISFGAFATLAGAIVVTYAGMFFGYAPGMTEWPVGLWVAIAVALAIAAGLATPAVKALIGIVAVKGTPRELLMKLMWLCVIVSLGALVIDGVVAANLGEGGAGGLEPILYKIGVYAGFLFGLCALLLALSLGLYWIICNLDSRDLEGRFLRLTGASAALGLVAAVVFEVGGLVLIDRNPSWRLVDAFVLAFPIAVAGALGTKWDGLRESVYLTVRTTAMVCWLFIGSWTFSSVFSYLGGEQVISDFVTGLNISPLAFLLLAQFIIFLLGWPLEWSEIIIIFVPIFLPLLPHFGIDPLFFGILVALNLQTSFLTPPMAMSAYYLKGIAPPHVQLVQIFRGCMPFLLMVFISMALLYVQPQIAYWLPDLIYSR